MGNGIVISAVSPHPPIIVPEIGGSEVNNARATVKGLEEVAARVVRSHPDTVIVITPHGPVLRDAMSVSLAQTLQGDFGQFGAPSVGVRMKNDLDLARGIAQGARALGIPCVASGERQGRLDHGSLVPLCYLSRAGLDCRLVVITMGMLERKSLYEFGGVIRSVSEKAGRRCALIASGDLSHRLTRDAPAGYSPRGRNFDRAIVDALEKGSPDHILSLDEGLAEAAGECGLRPIIIMLGALDGLRYTPSVLSYEGPFGVGYATAVFEIHERQSSGDAREPGDPFVDLARLALEAFVREGRILGKPAGLPDGMNGRAGAFVSLKKRGELRGCIGTIAPQGRDLADEIIRNAISAGSEDPRFEPVSPDELPDIEYSVDVLSEPEEIPDERHLDPRRYGVIVEKGYRRGLLLPDLEGVDTVERQVSIARRKAGIGPAEGGVRLYRFTVERHHA